MKTKKVYVRWIDSALTPGWIVNANKVAGTIEVETLGYLIYEDKYHIEVAQSIAPENISTIMSIPKSVILEMKKVRLKNAKF